MRGGRGTGNAKIALYLHGACAKQAICCRNHITKMALTFWRQRKVPIDQKN